MAKETDAEKEAREAQEAENGDMGTGAKATDGQPNGEGGPVSLADRRKGRTAAQLATDGSDAPPQDEEHDGQQAWDVDPTGKKMSLGSLCPRNVPVELKVKVEGKSVTLRGGVTDPTVEQIAVSSLVVEKFTISYNRDADGTIVKVIVTEHKVPKAINPAKSEAGQLLLGQATDQAAEAS